MQPQDPRNQTGQFSQPLNPMSSGSWPQQPPPNAMSSGSWPQQPPPNAMSSGSWPPQMPPNAMAGRLRQPQMPPNAMYPGQQQMYQPQSFAQTAAVNVNIAAVPQSGPNGCVRAIYFVFIGWWLGFWCLEIGFALCMFIVTLPVGLLILNRIPQIMTLKPTKRVAQTNVNVMAGAGGQVVNVNMSLQEVQQYPFIVRAVYYIFVGWWVGLFWANLAYFLCLTILGLPVGILMFDKLPLVLTLRKN